MRECMENNMGEVEYQNIIDMAKGLSMQEKIAFVSAIESDYLWNELIRREKEAYLKLSEISSLIQEANK